MNKDYDRDYPEAAPAQEDERVAAVQRLVDLEGKLEAAKGAADRADRTLEEVREAHRQHRIDVRQMLGFGDEKVPF